MSLFQFDELLGFIGSGGWNTRRTVLAIGVLQLELTLVQEISGRWLHHFPAQSATMKISPTVYFLRV